MEIFEVELSKGSKGLGVTIAGYVGEKSSGKWGGDLVVCERGITKSFISFLREQLFLSVKKNSSNLIITSIWELFCYKVKSTHYITNLVKEEIIFMLFLFVQTRWYKQRKKCVF